MTAEKTTQDEVQTFTADKYIEDCVESNPEMIEKTIKRMADELREIISRFGTKPKKEGTKTNYFVESGDRNKFHAYWRTMKLLTTNLSDARNDRLSEACPGLDRLLNDASRIDSDPEGVYEERQS